MTQLYLRLSVPAGRMPEILQALQAIRLPAQLDRECAAAQLSVDPQDPDVVLYTEDWRSAGGLEHRVASPIFRDLLSLVELASEPPTLEFREIAVVRGLEYVASVRRT